VIHLIIIRLERYSQRCMTVNVFPLYLFRVVFQDKLEYAVFAAYHAGCCFLPEQFLYNQNARQSGAQYFLGDRHDRLWLRRLVF